MNSRTLTSQKALFVKEEGKLKKLLVAIKKLFAKEFLWVLLVLLLSLPLALIITYIIETYASEQILRMITEILKDKPLFMGVYLLSLVGIYFARTVVGAINLLTIKPKS